MSEAPAKAIVVAAGRGRRLMPYTDQMPKCLVPVAGQPILARQLAAFRAHGIRDVVVIRGYLGDVLEARRDELGDSAIRFVDNLEFEHNNILESLFCARHELEGPLLVTYSDIVFRPEVVGTLLASEGDFSLVVDRDFRDAYEGRTEHPLAEAEVAEIDDDGLVRRVGKRALPADEADGEFIGLARLSAGATRALRDTWDRLVREYDGDSERRFQRAARFRNAYLTDILQEMIDGGVPIHAAEIRGMWREIDTAQDLQRASELLGCAEEDWR